MNMMLKGLSHIQHDFVVQALTSANNVLLKDGLGTPSAMVRIPMFLMSDVISGAPATPHPMFIINGDVKSEIFVGKYLSTITNGVAQSLHGRVPENNISFTDAIKATLKKGDGWHVMTNSEFAGATLLAKARGTIPRGNTNNGFSYSKSIESGILTADAKNSTTGTKYDSGYLYDIYNVVSNGNTNNVYRCLGDKTMPLYDWTTIRTIRHLVTGKGQLAYVLIPGNDNAVVDVFNKDTKTATYTVPDPTAYCMALDANDNIWVACKSGALYEITFSGTSLVSTIFTTAETTSMNMCFDATGNLWISAYNNGTLYNYNVSSKVVAAYTGFPGISKIAYHPQGYIFASLLTDKSIRRIALTNGTSLNTFSTTFSPRELVVDLVGNVYAAADAGTSQSIAKIDTSLNLTYITVAELDYVNFLAVTVDNKLQLTGTNATGLTNVVMYKNDVMFYKYTVGNVNNDTPITSFGTLFGDPNGLLQFKTFGISSDRYHLNQMYTYKTGTSNVRMYPYNADTIHISITGDTTFTGTYNHIEFDISGKAFAKLYFNVSATDINVKANDINTANLLVDLATLSYSATGDNITNTDGVVISNLVKSKLTLDVSAVVNIVASITKLVSYGNIDIVALDAYSGVSYNTGNTTRLKARLKGENIPLGNGFGDINNYTTPTLVPTSAMGVTYTSIGAEGSVLENADGTFYLWKPLLVGNVWYSYRFIISASGLLATKIDVCTYASTTYTSTGVVVSSVIKDGSSYRQFFFNQTTKQCCTCTSTDGIAWNSPVPITFPANSYSITQYTQSRIIKDGQTYKMWVGGYSTVWQIYYLESTDLVNWSAPLLAISAISSPYNSTFSSAPWVIKESDTKYRMWFAGGDGSDGSRRMLYSESRDGKVWSPPMIALSSISTIAQCAFSIGGGTVIKASTGKYIVWSTTLAADTTSAYIMSYTYKNRYVKGDTIEANIESVELNVLTPSLHKNTTSDWSAPTMCFTHGTYSGVTEAYGFSDTSVIKESPNLYKMWATSRGSATAGYNIIYMTSLDGKTWTSVPNIITFSNSATINYRFSSVIKKPNGTYLMAMTGRTISTDVNAGIYTSTSTDGINWTTPVLILADTVDNIGGKTLMYDSGIYRLWYDLNGTSLAYIESTDGITWTTSPRIVMTVGTAFIGTAFYMRIAKISNGNYIALTGILTNSYIRVHMATSSDGFNWSVQKFVMNYNNTAYDGIVALPQNIMVDGNKIKMWYVGENTGSTICTILYTERVLEQFVSSDTGDVVFKAKRYLRTPKYMFGTSNNALLNHDIIKVNNTYYLFFTKDTGSGLKVQVTTSTDLKNWSTPTDVVLPGVDATYPTSSANQSVLYDGTKFRVFFQVNNPANSAILYQTISSDGVTWSIPSKTFDMNVTTDCTVSLAKPSVLYDGNIYKIWFLGKNASTVSIMYSTSMDAIAWTTPVKVKDLGNITTDVTYISVYKKADGTYRMFTNDGTSNLYADSADGIVWGTLNASYKYPNDSMGYKGQSCIRILKDTNDMKMTITNLDISNNGTVCYREYDESTSDFAEATNIEARYIGDNYSKQTYLPNTTGMAVPEDSTIIKIGINRYMAWFTYTDATNSTSALYTANSTDGVNWTNFTKCFGSSTTTDTTLQHYFRKPSVIKDGSVYKMWLSTQAVDASSVLSIVYLTSYDGINWSVSTPCTTLGDSASNMAGKVIKDGSTYKAWTFVIGKPAVSYWESSDGIAWTLIDSGHLTATTQSSSYSAAFVNSVEKLGNEYKMYITYSSLSIPGDVFRLTSADGKIWYTDSQVSILAKTRYGNKSAVYKLSTLTDGKRTIGLYALYPNSTNDGVLSAILSDDGITFGTDMDASSDNNTITITKAASDNLQNTIEFETVTRTAFYNFAVGDKFRVDFKGSKDVIYAANATKLKLEVFGASGSDQGSTYIGGKGGYARGSLDTSIRKKLVAMIGSIGGYNKDSYGYNGGGLILDSTGKYYHGGGATDIRSAGNDLYRRLLVAGGGGSADSSDGTLLSGHSGGNGGGWTGTDGVGTNVGKGGTQSSGGVSSLTNLAGWTAGIFGSGAKDAITTIDIATLYGAGGGGYYGAGNSAQGAGGGSSYAAGNVNCPATHPEGLVLTDTGTTSGFNIGNGYAIVTVLAIDGSDGSRRTYNGSGPVTWNDTLDITGIADLVGNLNQMVTGLKISNKTFYVIKDNDAAMSTKDLSPTSADWKMLDANGNYIATGTGMAVNYAADFSSVDFSALALTANPTLAKALGIAPLDTTTTGLGFINGGISSEYFPIRGGYYASGNTAGMFNLSLVSKYTDAMPYTGFRVAYYKP